METQSNKLVKNTIMMYIMTVAKLVIPLISLPYLTRVLSVDCYGTVAFVNSLINYFQVFVDFGFLLSATKDIIGYLKKGESPAKTIGDCLYAQFLLCGVSAVAMVVCFFCLDILKGYELFTILSLLVVFLSVFLFEYVFKSYEEMGKVSIRYVIMRVISLILTLIFVKSDADILLKPIFEIVASIIAIILVQMQLKKMGIKIDFGLKRFKGAWQSLKKSFVYFISNFATTAFNVLNTIIIGIMLTTEDVAHWSIAVQLISTIQMLYNPIMVSAHPAMLKSKSLKMIHKIMLIYMPLIFVGCGMILLLGDWAIVLVFTDKYLKSSLLLKCLIPVLITSFPAQLYGWPSLDCINKSKATSVSTIISALVQVTGLVLLIVIGQFTLTWLCVVRCTTETVFCIIRMCLVYKNRNLYNSNQSIDKNSLEVSK